MTITANTSKLQLTNLDFDGIKASLIQFLKSQTQFQDYDFTGSSLNTLLDLLSYNTHYMAVYLNLVANEMFLDTAVQRSTVVSHAKALGYTPRSAVASLATVNVAITRSNTDNTAILTLPRFTQFTSSALNGVSFNYVTLDDETSPVSGNTFSFVNLAIKEGSPTVKTFIVDNQSNPKQLFDLIDAAIDTRTIQVVVQTSLTNTSKAIYELAVDAAATTADSTVFFIEEGTNGNYVLYFGDGIIGKKLSDGNIVIISYITTNADGANGLDTFTLQINPLSGSTSNVTTVNPSAGGTPIEDVASIKFTAPKSYIAQNRAVTKNDYIALINKNYPYFDAVNIWGGEEVVPPVYGKVYISAKPKNGFAITQQQKQFVIENVIKPISVLTVTAEFVDVDYDYLVLILGVEYDSSQTTASPTQLTNIVTAAVENYANLNLNSFNSEFRLSRLLRSIDDSENSILSSTATIYLEKRLTPALNVSQTYTVNTGISLHRGTSTDRLFTFPSFTINDVGGVPRQTHIEETPDSFSGLEQVNVLIPGFGYTSAPTLTIEGDGVGANAFATIVNGVVKSVTIDNQGSEYTTATVTASGGGGSGAKFTALLQGRFGVLRTFYYDNNNNKTIINPTAGSIDYNNGVIILDNFAPTAVNDPFGVLRIRVQPDTLTFGSSKSIIVTLDPNDKNAVTVNLKDENSQ